MSDPGHILTTEEFQTSLEECVNQGVEKVIIFAHFSCVHEREKQLKHFQQPQDHIAGAVILEVEVTLLDSSIIRHNVLCLTIQSLDFTVEHEFDHFLAHFPEYIDDLRKVVGDKIVVKVPQYLCAIDIKGIELCIGVGEFKGNKDIQLRN